MSGFCRLRQNEEYGACDGEMAHLLLREQMRDHALRTAAHYHCDRVAADAELFYQKAVQAYATGVTDDKTSC